MRDDPDQAKKSAEETPQEATGFRWPTKSMGANVDIEDKEAVWAILDESLIREHGRPGQSGAH